MAARATCAISVSTPLATTSAGLAFAVGMPDADWAVSRDTMLEHIAGIVTCRRPSGQRRLRVGRTPISLKTCRRMFVSASTPVSPDSPSKTPPATKRPSLRMLTFAVERIRAARLAIDRRLGVLLTARAECYLVGHPDPLSESIRRAQALRGCRGRRPLCPGSATRADIQAIVAAVGRNR